MDINLQPKIERRKIQYEGLEYLINYADLTAGVIGYNSTKINVMIPRSIIYESKEFIVISILEHAFDRKAIKSIEFAADSEVRTIENDAFQFCYVESISFPSSLIELKDHWNYGMYKLKKIEVMPNNKYFKVYDTKYLLRKSSLEKENYDILVQCIVNVIEVNIPNFIEIIGICAFSFCRKIRTIEFQPNSKLRIISNGAFNNCSFEKISIPPTVVLIDINTFFCCSKLKQIEIPKNSQLKTICGNAFNGTLIQSILFPSTLVELGIDWLYGMKKLEKIQISNRNPRFTIYDKKFVVGKSNIESNEYDLFIFAKRSMKFVTIPQFIKIIGPNSFNFSHIREINIPSNVTKICRAAFSSCFKIQKVNFDVDSKLQIIDNYAFNNSSIKSIVIPNSVEIIGEYAFPNKLQQIEIKKDSKLQKFDEFAFSETQIKSTFIPSHTKIIDKYTFSYCKKLQRVDISDDSELQIIDEFAFSNSAIKCFWIPPNVLQIGVHAFESCKKLQIVEIDQETKIQYIDQSVFENCKNTIIMIPAELSNLFNIQNLSI